MVALPAVPRGEHVVTIAKLSCVAGLLVISARATAIRAIFIALVFAVPPAVGAAAPEFTLCDGLKGLAAGLCRAGVAVGCGSAGSTAAGCEVLADNYTQATGEVAPWIAPPVFEVHTMTLPLVSRSLDLETGERCPIIGTCIETVGAGTPFPYPIQPYELRAYSVSLARARAGAGRSSSNKL
jgi:hypothetical protein